jgi:hypothetical protein
MAFINYWNELVGGFPRLDPLHAQQLTQRAWRLIRDQRIWSFNFVSDAEWWAPAVILTGTISAAFGSKQIQLDANAQAAVFPFILGNPPFAGPIGVGYQIRAGSLNTGISSPVGPLYSVVAYNAGTGIVTIDRPYGEQSGTGLQYLAYRAYYAAPNNPNTNSATPDNGFFRWVTLRNVAQGYDISGRRLLYTQEQLNRIDPQRSGIGDAYIVAQWGRSSSPGMGNYPISELYPHPVGTSVLGTGNQNGVATTYVGTYLSRWPDLSATQDLPQMPYALSDLVVTRAKVLACQWATANVGTFPELQQTNWVAAQGMYDKEFREDRIQCIKQDDEINPLIGFIQDGKFDFPLGGQFLQSHDISSLVP